MATIGWNNPQSQVIDLASSTLQARQLAQQKQQQQIANIMAIAQAYQQQQAQEQENQLKQQQFDMLSKQNQTENTLKALNLGLLPVQGNKFNAQDISGMSQEQLGSIMPKGGFTPGKFPINPEIMNIPGLGNVKKIEGMGQTKPLIVYDPNTGTTQTIANIPKGSQVIQNKPEITKANALNIISDPVKSQQLKDTYPDVYNLVESIAQDSQLKESKVSNNSINKEYDVAPNYDKKTQKLQYNPQTKKYRIVKKED